MNDIYPITFIIFGVVGIVFGFNRLIKKDDEESDLLKWIGALSGILLFGVIILVVLNDGVTTKYSIFFAFLYFLSLIARPLKKIPVAFIIAFIASAVLFYFVMNTSLGDQLIGGVDMKWIALGIAGVALVVFVIGLIQETW